MLYRPKVSIVTPSYNHARFLKYRIDTIRAQTFTDFEWIIVDDSSTDNSVELLKDLAAADKRVKLFVNDRNLGMSATVTRAIAESHGRYVYRAESDDACGPRLIERFLAVLDDHPRIGLVHCKGLHMDEANRIWGGAQQPKSDRIESGMDVFRRIVLRNDIVGGNMMFTRAAHDEVGGFARPPFESSCDFDFTLRLCLKYDVAYVGEALGFHRCHQHNLSTRFKRTLDVEFFITEHYEVLSRAFGDAQRVWGNMAELRKMAFSYMNRTAGADAFLSALRSLDFGVAVKLRERLQTYDPKAASSFYWLTACLQRFVWRLLYHQYSRAALALR